MSICKKYTFNKYIDNIFLNETRSLQDIIETASRESWDIQELFHFFSHPGMLNLTFPCTTVRGGTTPGKPCIFPITWKNKTESTCFFMDTSVPGCFTRAGADNVVGPEDQNRFGYCGQDCNGEKIEPDSPYNLAAFKYRELWTSDFFDLRTYENGFCHTYNPPDTSNTSYLREGSIFNKFRLIKSQIIS